MRKLKYKEIKQYRQQYLQEQSHICALCQQVIIPGQEVLDHCHKTGQIRSVLHRGCNALLGKIENSLAINCIDEYMLANICLNLVSYRTRVKDLIHPTFKTRKTKPAK